MATTLGIVGRTSELPYDSLHIEEAGEMGRASEISDLPAMAAPTNLMRLSQRRDGANRSSSSLFDASKQLTLAQFAMLPASGWSQSTASGSGGMAVLSPDSDNSQATFTTSSVSSAAENGGGSASNSSSLASSNAAAIRYHQEALLRDYFPVTVVATGGVNVATVHANGGGQHGVRVSGGSADSSAFASGLNAIVLKMNSRSRSTGHRHRHRRPGSGQSSSSSNSRSSIDKIYSPRNGRSPGFSSF